MERTLRVCDPDGTETLISGVDHPGRGGPGSRCPRCDGETFRRVTVAAGRWEVDDSGITRRSDYWGAERVLLRRCLECDAVLYKHPAYDLVYGKE